MAFTPSPDDPRKPLVLPTGEKLVMVRYGPLWSVMVRSGSGKKRKLRKHFAKRVGSYKPRCNPQKASQREFLRAAYNKSIDEAPAIPCPPNIERKHIPRTTRQGPLYVKKTINTAQYLQQHQVSSSPNQRFTHESKTHPAEAPNISLLLAFVISGRASANITTKISRTPIFK
jgi:hypothetical protein